MSALVTQQANNLAKELGMAESDGLTQALRDTAFGYNISDNQMFSLLVVANQYKLNPWTKEIYALPAKKGNGIIPVVGVDGWSRIINEHPAFDGMVFEDVGENVQMPGAKPCPSGIKCSIFRKDRKHPTSVTEYLDETYRPSMKGAGPWQTHTKRMLRHKAMIQCARLAFGYTGFYEPDEAARIQEAQERDMGAAQVVQDTPVQPAQPVQPQAAQRSKADEMNARMNIDVTVKEVYEELMTGIQNARTVEELKSIGNSIKNLSDEEKERIRTPYTEKLNLLRGGQKPDFNQVKAAIETSQTQDDLMRAFDMIKYVPQEQQTQLCELYEKKRQAVCSPNGG